jgi:YjbE family integral membrane protein
MNEDLWVVVAAVLKIIWIDLLLSGDNAVLIALACRQLPEKQRRLGIWLGSAGGVVLRVAFAFVIVQIMTIPYLKTVGGLLLLGVAVKLVVDESEHDDVAARESLWGAVVSIIMADAVMSLDNVIAIAAAARGSMALIIFGLALSVPIVVFGAGLVMRALDRYPILVWAGAALLGWVAGNVIADDPAWDDKPWFHSEIYGLVLSIISTEIVLLGAWIAESIVERRKRDK